MSEFGSRDVVERKSEVTYQTQDGRGFLFFSHHPLRLNSLFLSDISGDYTCEIETFGDPLSQRNQLDVLVPPVINMLNPGNNITVKRGSTVKLSCNATGFPQPEIVWQREVSL